jgi:hypothetical protein
MLPLPEPKRGGDLRELGELVNLGSEEDQKLIFAFLSFTLNPCGPYPILGFMSEQGSGKTTTAKTLRQVIDPNQAPIRALPKTLEDLAICANNCWVPTFDNLSFLPDAFSDAFCRLATGGGFATRAFYTNDEEAIFWSKRPVILNGIVEFASRPDLLERLQIIRLPSIPLEGRQSESEILTRFEALRLELLGALLDLASLALRELPNVKLAETPRMADFALWAAAVAPAIGAKAGEIINLVFERQEEALLGELDAPLPQALFELLDTRNGAFEMCLSELLDKLREIAGIEPGKKAPGWPKLPRLLLSALTRLQPVLRAAGVSIEVLGRTKRGRKIRILRTAPRPSKGDDGVTMKGPGDDERALGDDEPIFHRHPSTIQNDAKNDTFGDDGDDGDDEFPNLLLCTLEKKEEEEGAASGREGGEGQKRNEPEKSSLSSLSSPEDFLRGEI